MTDTDAKHLRDLTPHQWKSGIAAWLGWMFDGLDMHLYTLVAVAFVAQLMMISDTTDPAVKEKTAYIQAAFLVGWAVGGAFFGRIGDWLGRSKALILTILTYAGFTGLSFFAQSWEQLMICRFLAALGIGGEWAVGASLLAETWPKTWRPWLAAILQTGVNLGVLLASLSVFLLSSIPGYESKWVFLIGILPALVTLWIRHAVPETEAWHAAKKQVQAKPPGVRDLFRGDIRRTTLLTLVVCALGLSAHWAFIFWCSQHLRSLPEFVGKTPGELAQVATWAMTWIMVTSIIGNFVAALMARSLGYRTSIVAMFIVYGLTMLWCYHVDRTMAAMWPFLLTIGLCQGVFGLFTMYLPPLFPVLVRTTGAGFCYNFGRIAAAVGTVSFIWFSDYRSALMGAGALFLLAAVVAAFLPDRNDAKDA
jgi:predicted MFS family arabinose efflux permease